MAVDVERGAVRRAARRSSSAPSGRWRDTRASTSRSTLDADAAAGDPDRPKRLQQVLKNLLSNAFKFTEQGSVVADGSSSRPSGWSPEQRDPQRAPTRVVAFAVTDTGIGIPPDKHSVIFEAFQQADGTTSRKYGGTGLGLSISREIARLLGGEIRLDSDAGRGQHLHALPAARSTRSQPAGRPAADDDGSRTVAAAGRRRRQARHDARPRASCWPRWSSARSPTTASDDRARATASS